MQKLRKPTNPARVAAASTKLPMNEGKRSAEARRIVVSHCESTLEHIRDEKKNRADATMLGGYTRYGKWWHQSRDPAKRPFYNFEPGEVAGAIKDLDSMDAVAIADQLLFIARRSVIEYQPAADAARKKLSEIGMPVE